MSKLLICILAVSVGCRTAIHLLPDEARHCLVKPVCSEGDNCVLELKEGSDLQTVKEKIIKIELPVVAFKVKESSAAELCRINNTSTIWYEEQRVFDHLNEVSIGFPEFTPEKSGPFTIPAGYYRPRIRYVILDQPGTHSCECWGNDFD